MSTATEAPNETEMNSNEVRSPLTAALGLILMVLTALAYYVYHKPAGPAVLASLLGLGIDLLGALLVLSIATALGELVLDRWSHVSPIHPVAGTAVGLGIISFGILVLGFLGLLTLPVVFPGTLALLLMMRLRILGVVKRALISLAGLTPVEPVEWVLAVISAGLAVLTLVEAEAPPVRYDALVYHLALPQEFVRTGSLLSGVENPYWGQPLLGEMHFTWVRIITGRATAMAVTGWAVGIVAVAATYQLVIRLLGGYGWIAVAAMLAGATAWSSLGWGYVDWWAALAGAATITVLLELYEKPDPGIARLAGILAGLAIAIKLTAGILLLSGLIVLLVLHRSRKAVLAGAQMLVAAAIVYAPWVVKNVLATGQPFYPFAGETSLISSYQQAFYAGSGDAGLLDLFLAPVRATLIGLEGAPGFAASIGPLLLGLTIPGLLGWSGLDRRLRSLLATVLVWWLIWAIAAGLRPLLIQSRLYFVMYPAWAAAAAAGYRTLSGTRYGQVRLRVLAGALVIIVFALTGMSALAHPGASSAGATLFGRMSDEEYLQLRLGAAYPAMLEARDLGNSPQSVLMLWEPRSFYCAPVCVPDPWIGRWYAELREYGDPDSILVNWRQSGIEYLLTHDDGIRFIQSEDPRYTARDWQALSELLAELEPVEAIGASYTLYRIP